MDDTRTADYKMSCKEKCIIMGMHEDHFHRGSLKYFSLRAEIDTGCLAISLQADHNVMPVSESSTTPPTNLSN